MIYYLEFNNYSHLQEFLATKIGFNPLDFYTKKPLPFNKIKIKQWQDLQTQLDVDNLLFAQEQENIQLKNFLVNIHDLQINPYLSDFLVKIKNTFENLFLFSLDKDKLLAEEKKSLKKAKIDYQKLKSDKNLRLKSAQEYQTILNLTYSHSSLLYLAENSDSIQEVVDRLDFLALSGLSENQIKNYFSSKTPLFMLPFSVNNLVKNTLLWYQNLNSPDDLQLALSLLMTKLEKQKTKNNLNLINKIKKIILDMDFEMRNNNKIKPTVHWKLMLWKINQLSLTN